MCVCVCVKTQIWTESHYITLQYQDDTHAVGHSLQSVLEPQNFAFDASGVTPKHHHLLRQETLALGETQVNDADKDKDGGHSVHEGSILCLRCSGSLLLEQGHRLEVCSCPMKRMTGHEICQVSVSKYQLVRTAR